jgi:hypothetical protein
MMEFLDFLFVCVVLFYILRIVFRLVMPMVFQKVMNQAQQQQSRQQYRSTENQRTNYTQTNTSQTEIKVDYVPPRDKSKGSVPDSEGDFVDFEEVK